jgi:hypothetical protein
LFFVGNTDLKDGEPYTYEHPGFFRTSKLRDKLSSTDIDGVSDASHEKLAITDGDLTVYFADQTGIVYRARIVHDAASSDLEIHLAPAVQ